MAESRLPDAAQLERAAAMLKSIAHPMRVALLHLLEGGKRMTVTEIHQQLGIEQAAASHHLGILKNRGVVCSVREGKNSLYFLKNELINQVVECVNRCTCNE